MQLDLHIGYLLGESYWAKGYGSELIKGLVDWAYSDKHIRSLVGGVEINNTGSIKVMQKMDLFVQSWIALIKTLYFWSMPLTRADSKK